MVYPTRLLMHTANSDTMLALTQIMLCRTAAEAAAEAAATASKRRPGRPRKLQTPTQPIPRGKQQGAPQLRTTRQRRSTRAAMPQSPTHSGDLAADLAPGLLLDGDGEDSHAEHETNDPSFQPEVEEAELSNIAAIQQPTRTSSSPVTRTTTAEQDCGIMGGFVKTATDGDSGNRASGLSAVASELCTAKGCSARGVGSAGQPERATAAAQQVDDTSGHGVLAPGRVCCLSSTKDRHPGAFALTASGCCCTAGPLLIAYAVTASAGRHSGADVAILLCVVASLSGINYWLHMLTVQGVTSSHSVNCTPSVFVLLDVCVLGDMVDCDLCIVMLLLFCYMPMMLLLFCYMPMMLLLSRNMPMMHFPQHLS